MTLWLLLLSVLVLAAVPLVIRQRRVNAAEAARQKQPPTPRYAFRAGCGGPYDFAKAVEGRRRMSARHTERQAVEARSTVRPMASVVPFKKEAGK